MEQHSEKKLRIAVLSRHFSRHRGGAENYTVSLSELLADEHEVHVFCQSHSNQHQGIQVHIMEMSMQKPRWLTMLLFSAWTYWRTRRGFDIVHSHENVFHGNVQTFHVKPVNHNLFYGKHGLSWLIVCLKVATSFRLMAWLAVERARVRDAPNRLLIAASALLKDIYIDCFNLASTSVDVLTPGVQVPKPLDLEVSSVIKQTARIQLGLTGCEHWLLMVGHDYVKKGLTTLLQALRLLPEDICLAVVGDSSQIPEWTSKVSNWGIKDRVKFLGQQTQMNKVYQACDLFVHATLEDVFPIVVLEAMAHGLPVVVSPTPFCLSSDLLTSDVNAVVLKDPHDAQALAYQILRLRNDDSLASNLVKHASIFVQNYSWETLVQSQLNMYRKLLG